MCSFGNRVLNAVYGVVLVVCWCVPLGGASVDGLVQEVMSYDKAQVMSAMPGLDMALMFRFYEEYSSDLLEEWRQKCSKQPRQSTDYLRRLAVHFLKLEDVRKTDPVEYKRLIGYEIQQNRIRRLSREIQAMRAADAAQVVASDGAVSSEPLALGKAKEELWGILEQSIDESLRQQEYEVDKLEQEIVELRQIISLRRKNRQAMLEQRFKKLCGE